MNWQTVILITIVILFTGCIFLVQYYYRTRLHNEISRAQRSERIKTVFMANVSHALRTPLNAIINDSKKMLDHDGMDRKQMVPVIENINQHGKQLLYFISQLLELSSFDSNMNTITMIS